MRLHGKSADPRMAFVSVRRVEGNGGLAVLCCGDHGLWEYEVAPGQEPAPLAPRRRLGKKTSFRARVCTHLVAQATWGRWHWRRQTRRDTWPWWARPVRVAKERARKEKGERSGHFG